MADRGAYKYRIKDGNRIVTMGLLTILNVGNKSIEMMG